MCKKLICLISCFVMLTAANHTWGDLVAHWEMDEGGGDVIVDSSGNGHDGPIEGTPDWVAGKVNLALNLDGATYARVPGDQNLDLLNHTDFTVTVWFTLNMIPSEYTCILQQANGSGTGRTWLGWHASGEIYHYHGGTHRWSTLVPEPDTWYHAAYVITEGGGNDNMEWYINGELVASESGSLETNDGGDYVIGSQKTPGHFWDGLLDDMRFYNHALTQAEILAITEGSEEYPFAYGPDPKDGALITSTWVTLRWQPGESAVSHDVYLGDSVNDVSEATHDSDVFWGNQAETFYVAGFPGFAYPGGLVPGTTYYWRIDEVDETNPDSPWKGPVWSFSVPSKTAYNPDPVDGAEGIDPNSTILRWTPGFGAILHTTYLGDDFDTVSNATGGVPDGIESYNPGPLELEKVYYWRVDEFDAVETHKGDVWSFTTPGAVGNPQPAYNAVDVQMNAGLSWMPADSAASHEVYFGMDKDTVRHADAGSSEYKGSMTLGAESYDPGLLDSDTTYYWRVDEVDTLGNISKGPLWMFTTGRFLLVDDFEGYTDDDAAGRAIWQTWIDGFGVADNGAQVGYLMPPYTEQSIFLGGAQSMPLVYTNEAGVTNSEATTTLTASRDWTQAGVTELSLWLRGSSSNAVEPLYVAISNTTGAPAIVAHEDQNAAKANTWMQWRVLLQTFTDQGINLTNVEKIAIGLGSQSGTTGVGGSGTIYIDDIRLY